MPIKSVKMKISKNKKMRFFLMSQGSLNPKIRFLCQKVCPRSCLHTVIRTYRQSDYCGHPFRVSGFFLQPITKDRPNIFAQYISQMWNKLLQRRESRNWYANCFVMSEFEFIGLYIHSGIRVHWKKKGQHGHSKKKHEL